jgi:hypothetical protein
MVLQYLKDHTLSAVLRRLAARSLGANCHGCRSDYRWARLVSWILWLSGGRGVVQFLATASRAKWADEVSWGDPSRHSTSGRPP